ncbi:MAG: thioredoxin family protein [Saprospiraceae bacterium]|jgi:hypothetical protein|nr:thioredoxin family protein [Saprospiraceae bacterium]
MKFLSDFVFCLLMALFVIPARSQSQPEELGLVRWLRDMNSAQEKSKSTGKPILILFQEVPGCSTCKNYGEQVMSHPLIVEAIETYFIPLCIYNNRGGSDKQILDYFQEPSWNNPVVRIVDAQLKEVSPRLNGNYSAYAMVSKINVSLIKSGKLVPQYLQLLEDELQAQSSGVESLTVGMYCFWSGEKTYGKLDGVVATKAGFVNGKEVVQVQYDPKKTSAKIILEEGRKSACADAVYLDKTQKLDASVQIERKSGSGFREDREVKYYLQHHDLRYIPMTETQSARVNSALALSLEPTIYLSPRQNRLLQKVKSSSSKSGFENYIGKPISTGTKILNDSAIN